MQIETPQDWWQVLDDNWDDVLDIIYQYSKMDEVPLNGDVNPKFRPLTGLVEQWKRERDFSPMRRTLGNAWFNAPNNRHLHDRPGWLVLCSLCSEDWVFEEEERR